MYIAGIVTIAVIAGAVRLIRTDRKQCDAQQAAWRAWDKTGKAQPGWDPAFKWSENAWTDEEEAA